MKLLVDIGNSALKWTLRENGTQGPGRSLPYPRDGVRALLDGAWGGLSTRPDAVYVASVAGAEVEEGVRAFVRERWGLDTGFVQTRSSQCGVQNAYADPAQMGVDRWLAIIAAWARVHAACCVVNCGTALTVDGVDADGRHVGGAIIPGIQLMQSALAYGTARIPETQDGRIPDHPGRSTEECVRLGTVIAAAAFVDRMAHVLSESLGREMRGIISGGAAGQVRAHLSTKFEYDPELVLNGLALTVDELA